METQRLSEMVVGHIITKNTNWDSAVLCIFLIRLKTKEFSTPFFTTEINCLLWEDIPTLHPTPSRESFWVPPWISKYFYLYHDCSCYHSLHCSLVIHLMSVPFDLIVSFGDRSQVFKMYFSIITIQCGPDTCLTLKKDSLNKSMKGFCLIKAYSDFPSS